MNPQDECDHYWLPVMSDAPTLFDLAFDELAMRARPEPARLRAICRDCGAVEYR